MSGDHDGHDHAPGSYLQTLVDISAHMGNVHFEAVGIYQNAIRADLISGEGTQYGGIDIPIDQMPAEAVDALRCFMVAFAPVAAQVARDRAIAAQALSADVLSHVPAHH